jgi:ribosomal 50S subunit-recycling heat shock protein
MSKKVKVKLSGKVKYNGNRHRAGSEIEVDEKDVSFFKDNDLVSKVIGEIEEKEPKPPAENEDDSSKKENDQPTDEELEEMNSDELYEVAQDIKLEGRSGLRNDKDKLLAAVKEALAEKDGE